MIILLLIKDRIVEYDETYKTSEKEETFEDIQTWTGIISRPQNVITP